MDSFENALGRNTPAHIETLIQYSCEYILYFIFTDEKRIWETGGNAKRIKL